ncbi:hypothetical protein ACOTCG_06990 [Achromobacter xylosoxidans]
MIAQALAAHRNAALPSELVVSTDVGYVLHLAARDATWFMDGYWPLVQFAVDDVPIAWVCES